MMTEASIIFRASAQRIIPSLPPELASLAEFTHNIQPLGDPPSAASRCVASLSAAQIDCLMNWRHQTSNGHLLLRSINLKDQFDQNDLCVLPAVEIVAADEVTQEDDPTMDCTEDNEDAAYTGWWDCDHCRRVRWLQTDDLEVTLPRALDFQKSTLGNWFVSNRVAPLLEAHAVRLRPLKNRDDYQQIACGPVAVRTDLWPVSAEHPCPHCGRPQIISRTDIIEGTIVPAQYAGVNVRRWSALTLLSDEFLPAWGRANPSFVSLMHIEGQEPHYVGQQALPADVNLFTHLRRAYYLSSQSLYRALLEAGATGLKFLPVNAPLKE